MHESFTLGLVTFQQLICEFSVILLDFNYYLFYLGKPRPMGVVRDIGSALFGGQ